MSDITWPSNATEFPDTSEACSVCKQVFNAHMIEYQNGQPVCKECHQLNLSLEQKPAIGYFEFTLVDDEGQQYQRKMPVRYIQCPECYGRDRDCVMCEGSGFDITLDTERMNEADKQAWQRSEEWDKARNDCEAERMAERALSGGL